MTEFLETRTDAAVRPRQEVGTSGRFQRAYAPDDDDMENGPAEDTDTGTSGNTDERSSENRRAGLEKDRERARDSEDVRRGSDDE